MATIISRLPQRRQTLLFSATMPDKVLTLVREYLTKPRVMNVGGSNATALPESLVLRGHVLSAADQKPAALFQLLNAPDAGRALVFANTRDRVEELTRFLRGRGVAAEALHGKMLQPERDKSMMKLRNGSATVLVATDVAARGLDVNELDTVVQFDPPHDTDTFQHRAGRTARAGAVGTAHLLVTPPEQQKIQAWPTAKAVQWAGLRPAAAAQCPTQGPAPEHRHAARLGRQEFESQPRRPGRGLRERGRPGARGRGPHRGVRPPQLRGCARGPGRRRAGPHAGRQGERQKGEGGADSVVALFSTPTERHAELAEASLPHK